MSAADPHPGADRRCRCGHERAAHEHYRRGTDCALCPDGSCSRYVRAGSQPGLRRLLALLRLSDHA